MKTLKTLITAIVLTVGSVAVAKAQVGFHVSVNTPGVRVHAGNYRPAYRSVAYHEVYRPAYRPVVYREVYRRPVVYREVYRPAYRRHVVYRNHYRPQYRQVVYSNRGYHRGHGRW